MSDRLDHRISVRHGAASASTLGRARLIQISTAISLFVLCMLSVGVLTAGILALRRSIRGEGGSDFVQYWAAGQLLTHGANPYDAVAAFKLESVAARGTIYPQITLSPPIIFVMIAPLGFVSAKTGAVLWTVLLAACMVISVQMLWMLHGQRTGGIHFLCYCFAPVLACQMSGQIGVFLLTGIVLFLYLHKRRPALAGAALVVCITKFQLFLPFGAVLIFWALRGKQYRILAGIGAALLVLSAFPVVFDRHIWSQYVSMMSSTRPAEIPVPSLSRMFRVITHRDSRWLEFVPVVVGCIWAIGFYYRRRNDWNWHEHGLPLLLVSIACAPYMWFTDEVVLVPVILAALYRAQDSGRSILPFGLLAAIPLVELLRGIWITTPYFIWTVPAWIAWYLYASKGRTVPVTIREQTP